LSESKHTPGPWKVMENGNPLSAGIVAIIQHSPERLLTVEEDHFGGPWCAPETWEANARLIAAAPELLAMLRKVADTLPSLEWTGQGCCPFCGYVPIGQPEVPCALRALIAKAEGGVRESEAAE
jgi:hypothetical protein